MLHFKFPFSPLKMLTVVEAVSMEFILGTVSIYYGVTLGKFSNSSRIKEAVDHIRQPENFGCVAILFATKANKVQNRFHWLHALIHLS